MRNRPEAITLKKWFMVAFFGQVVDAHWRLLSTRDATLAYQVLPLFDIIKFYFLLTH